MSARVGDTPRRRHPGAVEHFGSHRPSADHVANEGVATASDETSFSAVGCAAVATSIRRTCAPASGERSEDAADEDDQQRPCRSEAIPVATK